MQNNSTKSINDKYKIKKQEPLCNNGQIIAYTLGQNIDVNSIVPIPLIGRISLCTLNLSCIKDSDKDDILNLLNYELNTSGIMYMLSILYTNKDEFNATLNNIISTFFNNLYIINKKQQITYLLVYKNLNYFKQLKKNLVV